MNDGLIVNGKTLHPDMKAMLDARANAGPAETIAEQRTAWTAYSQALSQAAPRRHEGRRSRLTAAARRRYRPRLYAGRCQ